MADGNYHDPDIKVGSLEDYPRVELIKDILQLLDEMDNGQARFPQFRLLPAELRYRVWEMTIPRRTLRPFCRPPPAFEDYPESWRLPPPVVAQVCRESRHVARLRGCSYRLSHSSSDYCTWFDGSRDLLDLANSSPHEFISVSGLDNLFGGVETVLLDKNSLRDEHLTQLFRNRDFRQKIRTIYLQIDDPITLGKRWWHPHVVAKVFADDELFTFVELENPSDIEWLGDRVAENKDLHKGKDLQQGKTWSRKCELEFARVEGLREYHRDVGRCKEAKQAVMKLWLSHDGQTPLPTEDCLEEADDGSIEEAIARNPESFSGIPRIRLVQSFEQEDPVQGRRGLVVEGVTG